MMPILQQIGIALYDQEHGEPQKRRRATRMGRWLPCQEIGERGKMVSIAFAYRFIVSRRGTVCRCWPRWSRFLHCCHHYC